MEKRLTRKEQAQITEKIIYDSALALIESKGYENMSIEDITTKVNTAKGEREAKISVKGQGADPLYGGC